MKTTSSIELVESTADEISFLLKIKVNSPEDFLDPIFLEKFFSNEIEKRISVLEKRRESPHHYENRLD